MREGEAEKLAALEHSGDTGSDRELRAQCCTMLNAQPNPLRICAPCAVCVHAGRSTRGGQIQLNRPAAQ